MDPKAADKLLDLLSTDTEFRRLFKQDPNAALVRVGAASAVPPSGAAPACMQVNSIAPKEEIAKARAELKSHLTSTAGYTTPHCFEAGKVQATLKKK
jgi:putative modified peptide